jgi:heme exporter protein C
MKGVLWKSFTIVLLVFVVVMGFLGDVPALDVLNETIRNLYFHVPLWFAMILLLLANLVYSIRYLYKEDIDDDLLASSLASTGLVFGVLGYVTGMLWGNYTWGKLGTFLFSDPKTLGSMISILIYLAYFVLRGSLEDDAQKARVSAVYSIFAYTLMIFFIFVFPRLADSIHPGNGGNPAFAQYDLDNNMRLVFYPAVIGYTMLAAWIAQLEYRIKKIEYLQIDNPDLFELTK